MANLFLTGAGVPDETVGEITDYYRDTVTNLIYYRAALGWEVVPSLVPTPDGVGTNWLFGTGAPTNGIGAANDYYRDDGNGSIYRKHAVHGWQAKGALNFIGVYGVQWGEGTGAPADIESLNNLPAGSFYLDVATSDIYYKDNTLTWSLKGQLAAPVVQEIEDVQDSVPSSAAVYNLKTTLEDSLIYEPREKTGTTYILETEDCKIGCPVVVELSNDSFTEMYLATPNSLGVTVGMGFNVVITGDYNGQTLAVVEESGATLLGSPAFTDTNHCKTVVAWSSSSWRIFG